MAIHNLDNIIYFACLMDRHASFGASRCRIAQQSTLDAEERLANIICDSIYPRLVPNIEISSWRKTYLILVEVYPSNSRPHYLKNKGLEKGSYIRIGSTNRLADSIIINELQRFVRSEAYDEQPIIDLNSEAIDFRAASELFSEYRNLKKSDLHTLKLTTKHQGKEVPTIGGMILFGKEREKYFPDAWTLNKSDSDTSCHPC